MTRTTLWKTSWLGQELAETRPCLGPAKETPPPGGPAELTCGAGEGEHFWIFFWRLEGQVWRLCLPVSMSLGPELGRKWGKIWACRCLQNSPGSFHIKCICILRSVLPTLALQRKYRGFSGVFMSSAETWLRVVGEEEVGGLGSVLLWGRCFSPNSLH